VADSIGGPARRTLRQLTPARIAGGAALRVRSVTAGERNIEGGPALPVYYVQDSELRSSGGAYTLQGNPPVPIFEAEAGAIIEGRSAIPVYVTNPADGEQAPLLELQADTGVTTSTAQFSGTGVITQSGTTVSGVGTAFLSEVVVGDRIQAIGIDGIVQSIATDTSLTLDTSATVAIGIIYTITPQAGTARVSTWLDPVSGQSFTQSGTARPSKQTIGGYPAVVFDGVNDWMLGPDFADNLDSFTCLSVFHVLSGGPNGQIISKMYQEEGFLSRLGWHVQLGMRVHQGEDNWINVGLSTINPNFQIRNVFSQEKISNSELHVYVNGVQDDDFSSLGTITNFGTTEPVRLGIVGGPGGVSDWGYSNAILSAEVIYSPALSASARAAKEQELATRYGITL